MRNAIVIGVLAGVFGSVPAVSAAAAMASCRSREKCSADRASSCSSRIRPSSSTRTRRTRQASPNCWPSGFGPAPAWTSRCRRPTARASSRARSASRRAAPTPRSAARATSSMSRRTASSSPAAAPRACSTARKPCSNCCRRRSSAPRRSRAGRLDGPRRADQRPAAVRLAGAAAGRGTALLQQGGTEELHRPHGPAQAEYPANPPHRRSGLAGGDQAVSQADRGRRLAEVDRLRTRREGRHGLRQGRPLRWLLHAGRHPGARRLRQGPLRDHRAGDRDARPLGSGAVGVSRVQLFRRTLRPRLAGRWASTAPETTRPSPSCKTC